jgi:hypothetical protein
VSYASYPEHVAYWQSGLQAASALSVPLTFYAPQWEFYLSRDPYLSLPYAQNPNVWTNGKAQSKVSPFGPLAPWYELGRQWGSGAMMTQLQTWYPSPPLILFLSNNEHPKLLWTEAETDQHYLDLYGTGRSPEFKRQIVAEGWIARYRELQRGFRDGLTSVTWKAKARFIGYEAFGKEFLGRFWGWSTYALPTPNRIDPHPLMWDGGSPSYYLAYYFGNKTDFRLLSPQIESMNWVFMEQEARRLNQSFWFEISTWSGGIDLKNTKQAWLETFTPIRYGAMVQYGMWLVRPRLIREFPYSGQDTPEQRSVNLPWLSPILAAVDRVYTNAVLQRFWRQSALVENTSRPHPYQLEVPLEGATAPRMFLLTTNLDPPQPWVDTTGNAQLLLELPVFALARVIGSAPTREWLIYAHSPLQDRSSVQITIPNYHPAITVDVPIAGAFYRVNEADGSVTRVTDAPSEPTPLTGPKPPTNLRVVTVQ